MEKPAGILDVRGGGTAGLEGCGASWKAEGVTAQVVAEMATVEGVTVAAGQMAQAVRGSAAVAMEGCLQRCPQYRSSTSSTIFRLNTRCW